MDGFRRERVTRALVHEGALAGCDVDVPYYKIPAAATLRHPAESLYISNT